MSLYIEIKTTVNKIKNAYFGVDVRDNIAEGIDKLNDHTEGINIKQTNLETTFKNLVINAGNSNAEIAASRGDFDYLPDRMDNFDEQFNTKVNMNQYYIDVKSFGAKSDNITDDLPAIKEALQYAENIGGGVVYLPPGKYLVSDTILVPSNVHFRGENSSVTIISPTEEFRQSMKTGNLGSYTSWNMLSNSNFQSNYGAEYNSNYNIKVSDLKFEFDSMRSEENYKNNCIGFNNCKQITVENCYFINFAQHSVDIAGCELVTIQCNYSINGIYSSIQVDNAGGLYQPATAFGQKSRLIYIKNNYFNGNNTENGAIQIHKEGGDGIYIENNTIENVMVGICTDDYYKKTYGINESRNVHIKGNYVVCDEILVDNVGIRLSKNITFGSIEDNYVSATKPLVVKSGNKKWITGLSINNNIFLGDSCEITEIANSNVSNNYFITKIEKNNINAIDTDFTSNTFKGQGVYIKDLTETDLRDNSSCTYRANRIMFVNNKFVDNLGDGYSFAIAGDGTGLKQMLFNNNYYYDTKKALDVTTTPLNQQVGLLFEDSFISRKRTVLSTSRPSNILIGTLSYDENLKKPIWFDGSNWKDAVGDIV